MLVVSQARSARRAARSPRYRRQRLAARAAVRFGRLNHSVTTARKRSGGSGPV